MQVVLRVFLIPALVAAVVAATTAYITVRLLGPSASSSQSSSQNQSGASVVLEGMAEVPWGEEVVVHYKAPFATAPYLTFPEGLERNCKVTEQTADHFKLHAAQSGAFIPLAKVKWKAEGQSAK
jgi:hypothetical protein